MPAKRQQLNLTDSAGITGPNVPTGAGGPLGIVGAITAAPAAGRELTAALDDIAENPGNPRTDLGDLTELAASIAQSGLVQPLIVASTAAWHAEHPDRGDDLHGKPWVLIAGHRRLAAAKSIDLHDLPITVRDHLADASTRSALIENIHRQDLPPLDEAAAFAELLSHGMSQRELARQTGISQPKISKRVALLNLPAAAKIDLSAGDLTVTDALRLLDLPAGLHTAVYDQAKEHGYTLDSAIRITQARLDTATKVQALTEQLTADGIRIIADPATEFGANSWTHHLWDPTDIDAAKTAGICVACLASGNVEYFATTPKPWPWQPHPAEHKAAEHIPTPEEIEGQRRLAAIHHYLTAQPDDPTTQLPLLAGLTLITSECNENENQVADLLGRTRPNGWGDYLDSLIAAAGTDDAVHTALALTFARAETLALDDHTDDDGPLPVYLELLSRHLHYAPAVAAQESSSG